MENVNLSVNLEEGTESYSQGCRSLLSIGGGQFALLPQFFPIFKIRGMNLDYIFFQVSKLSEDQMKKKVFTKNGRIFSRIEVKTKKSLLQKWKTFSTISGEDLCSDADQSQIMGEDADSHHAQITWGIQ